MDASGLRACTAGCKPLGPIARLYFQPGETYISSSLSPIMSKKSLRPPSGIGDNPADLLTRGMDSEVVNNSRMQGPSWQSSRNIPKYFIYKDSSIDKADTDESGQHILQHGPHNVRVISLIFKFLKISKLL